MRGLAPRNKRATGSSASSLSIVCSHQTGAESPGSQPGERGTRVVRGESAVIRRRRSRKSASPSANPAGRRPTKRVPSRRGSSRAKTSYVRSRPFVQRTIGAARADHSRGRGRHRCRGDRQLGRVCGIGLPPPGAARRQPRRRGAHPPEMAHRRGDPNDRRRGLRAGHETGGDPLPARGAPVATQRHSGSAHRDHPQTMGLEAPLGQQPGPRGREARTRPIRWAWSFAWGCAAAPCGRCRRG